MGAEWSVDGSYSLGEQFDCDSKFWTIYPAISKNDGSSCTVFIHDIDNQENQNAGLNTDKPLKYLRTLRHPGLLKSLKVFESSSEVSVVTEPVVPLQHVLKGLHSHEVIAGIYSVIATVAFLHDKCKLSHNNLCLDSLFIGQNDACWKIGAFECMIPFNEMTKEVMESIKSLRNDDYIPPESGDVGITLPQSHDIFGSGKLVLDILDQIETSDDPEVDHFRETVETNFLNIDPQARCQVSSLLNNELFKNDYLEILNFLNNITVKSCEEKATFFSQLHYTLKDLPTDIVANRLLHLLLSRFVLVDPVAVEVFLPHLLTPLRDTELEDNRSMDVIPLLPEQLYKQCCLPILSKLFEVNDRHVRLILLKYFHLYVAMFDKDVLENVILKELNVGLHDCDDELVSATFSALQFLVPILGSQVVLGAEGTRQFTDRSPKFTTRVPQFGVSVHDQVENDHQRQNKQYSMENKAGKMTLLAKAKLKGSVQHQGKITERERRKQETKRRNEERRKNNRLLKLEKEMTKKTSKVEEVRAESHDDFQPWEDLSPENDLNVEVSDGSEHGRPSSSEISLDSGYSEKNRVQSSVLTPILPSKSTDKSEKLSDTAIDKKLCSIKPNSAMKLGKPKRNSKKTSKSHSLPQGDQSTNTQQNHLNHSKKTVFKNPVDVPWEEFDIRVRTVAKEDDIFSDMAPAITFVKKAPVKGTSIYSDTLSVDPSNEVIGDEWTDDDW